MTACARYGMSMSGIDRIVQSGNDDYIAGRLSSTPELRLDQTRSNMARSQTLASEPAPEPRPTSVPYLFGTYQSTENIEAETGKPKR